MKLIVALGNPGIEYYDTRHNIGFQVADIFAAKNRKGFTTDKYYELLRMGETIVIKPNTFMNLSGRALKAAIDKWQPDEVLVVYDDLELNPTQIRIRQGGGDGGHNGIKSLVEVYPSDDLKRIRVGIGRPHNQSSKDYVLEAFNEVEREQYALCFDAVCKLLDVYVRRGFTAMLDEYSKSKQSYSGIERSGIISPKEEKRD